MPVTIRVLTVPPEAPLLEQIVGVYRSAFAPPPYSGTEQEVAHFADLLPCHAAREGFRCAIATEDDALAGFAYGYASQTGQWWQDRVRAALDSATAVRWLKDAFEFVELAVLPTARGRGIGTMLHDALLDGAGFRTAVLSTLGLNTPAMRLYRRCGWIPIRELPGGGIPMVLMGLDLPRAEH